MNQVRLRPTTPHDLDYVLAAESHPANAPYVQQWNRETHHASLTDPDYIHMIVERCDQHNQRDQPGDTAPAGYVILSNVTSIHQCILLKRLVMTDKGRGYGRATLRLVKAMVFEELHAHRLTLDVMADNHTAQHLYKTEGFVAEGLLRECIRRDNRFESVMMMGLLRSEYV